MEEPGERNKQCTWCERLYVKSSCVMFCLCLIYISMTIQCIVTHTVRKWIKMCLSVVKLTHTWSYTFNCVYYVRPCKRVSDITSEACNQAALSVSVPSAGIVTGRTDFSLSHTQTAKQHFINHTNRLNMRWDSITHLTKPLENDMIGYEKHVAQHSLGVCLFKELFKEHCPQNCGNMI